MNDLDLIDALSERLKNLFYGERFLNRRKDSSEYQDVKIFAQYIPQSEGITLNNHGANAFDLYTEDDFMKNFPGIIVKFLERTDNEEKTIIMSQIAVKLLVCVYDESPENAGYRDVLNMIAMMRDSFRSERFIAGKYRILMPLKSKLIEADSWPVCYGEIELKLETGRKLEPNEYIYRMRGAKDERRVEEYGII